MSKPPAKFRNGPVDASAIRVKETAINIYSSVVEFASTSFYPYRKKFYLVIYDLIIVSLHFAVSDTTASWRGLSSQEIANSLCVPFIRPAPHRLQIMCVLCSVFGLL